MHECVTWHTSKTELRSDIGRHDRHNYNWDGYKVGWDGQQFLDWGQDCINVVLQGYN